MTDQNYTATSPVGIADAIDAETLMDTFRSMWGELNAIGVGESGVRRFSWTGEDAALRDWFTAQAEARGMDVATDVNGNIRAWWGIPEDGAVATGSHLDSVPDGGLWDGPLGVVLGFLAVDALAAAEQDGTLTRRRPLAVVDYMDEEGARFGVACLGSKLMSGAIDPEAARSLTDADGVTLAEAMLASDTDPQAIGEDPGELARIGAQVEVHIEQGKNLAGPLPGSEVGAPVGVATAIWPHGRWEFIFEGVADHAGTCRMEDRRDAGVPFAATVLAARSVAEGMDGARATFGRFHVEPGGPNVVPAKVVALLDARAKDDATLEELVDRISGVAKQAAGENGVTVSVVQKSYAPVVDFDPDLREMHAKLAADAGEYLPELPTQAGHDSGILAARVPTSMLFVRSPHGISHSPLEDAAEEDVVAGLRVLVRALAHLMSS
ncbi:MAG TPA: allantoate amidohydrolase [Candidatus Corynebacterium avicola]|uniref:Allantoate amidohydrolase n=1 Tax=Candidatus Corynebacterium avicola TaxID=2838527 RepID=A0A9D1RR28_9CORY|nr:allantoate amidohydrolase [Candidatus Corynebacterium avicola]